MGDGLGVATGAVEKVQPARAAVSPTATIAPERWNLGIGTVTLLDSRSTASTGGPRASIAEWPPRTEDYANNRASLA
ncbi:hypothetical protein SCMU_10670 [Sinomonas cyclohexanicum]|uniref:Uncharacterized protein n=1 Tax=Sinomonas cyclohexanicum TaxID=322009 RepID=A0ABM7PSM4_SINCY|nr:hypothetical protein SCMU_10670 [Corynebacterium cyclohexanicum]